MVQRGVRRSAAGGIWGVTQFVNFPAIVTRPTERSGALKPYHVLPAVSTDRHRRQDNLREVKDAYHAALALTVNESSATTCGSAWTNRSKGQEVSDQNLQIGSVAHCSIDRCESR
jgi:hypothetical protein